MPPRRKGISTTKTIKGIMSTEEIDKAANNLSTKDDPLGFAAVVKPRGRKVARSAKEKGEADDAVVPNMDVSIRSSKQKALLKILSMDKEDGGTNHSLRDSLQERENECSAATVSARHNTRKRQGPRSKMALKSIPEDVATEENFVEADSQTVSEEVKEESEFYANEDKPGRGKRCARSKENHQCKLKTEHGKEQQNNESQQWTVLTCLKASRKRGGSSILPPGQSTSLSPNKAPGNLLKNTRDCISLPTGKLDSLPQEPMKPEPNNVRSSNRTKKVVHYNECSPENDSNNVVFVRAQGAIKRNTSTAKLLPQGAKRVKDDTTSTLNETFDLDSTRETCVKRGRRYQKLTSMKPKETGGKEECSEEQEEIKSEKVTSSSVFNSVDFDGALLLQTDQLESAKFSQAEESAKRVSATGLEKMSNVGSIMHEKHVNQNMPLSQDHLMADESATLEMLSTAADESALQQSIQNLQSVSDRKRLNTSNGRKVNSKCRTLPKAAHRTEGSDAVLMESDEETKPKVLESSLVQGAANSMTDAKPEETCGTHDSVDLDRKLHCESRNRGRNIFVRKRTLQGNSHQTKKKAKKQQNSALDTLPSPASLGRSAPSQNQEHQNVAQKEGSQGWNAVDITNSEVRVERSSEKKRREEVRRKKAMMFDALPVGFGLGISCWSTLAWENQSIGVVELVDSPVIHSDVQLKSFMEEGNKEQCLQEMALSKDTTNTNTALDLKDAFQLVDSSVRDFQVQLRSSIQEAKKQLYLQETAMPKDATNTVLDFKDRYHAPSHSPTRVQVSSFSAPDAQRLPKSGMKLVLKNGSNNPQEKALVKRQVTRKTKTSKALSLESSPAVKDIDSKVLDKENLDPKHHVHNDASELKMSRSSQRRMNNAGKQSLEPELRGHKDESECKQSRTSQRRIANAGKEKITRTRRR